MGKENENEKQEQSKIKTILSNFVYLIMLLGIIIAIIYGKDFISSNEENKKRFPLFIIVICALVLVIFIVLMVSSAKEFPDEQKKERQPVFVERISKEDYEREKEEFTRREVEKLYRSKQFNEMKKEKGDNKENWIWQSREKAKKTVWRENENSEDCDNLSQITLSDN